MTTFDTTLPSADTQVLTEPAPKKRPARKRPKATTIVWIVAMIALTAVVLYPLIWMGAAAFKPNSEFGGQTSLLPQNPTIDNFVKVFAGVGGVPLWQFFLNSTVLAIGSVIGVVISSSMAAYAFARLDFRGRPLYFALMIGTLLLPMHVLLIPQYTIFRTLGMMDTYWPLLIGKFLATEAFFVFLMVQFIRNLPRELDEAARIDGAGHIRVFGSITIPLIRPALITSSIFAFIWSWNDFLGPLLYLNTPDKQPLPLALRVYNDQTSASDYGATIAVSVLALLPVLIFFIIFQRFLVDGVATQGLKG
ncbi:MULTISPECIES: carbohydrate ABC transporter permease [Rathayibacter]|jgi:multiple sugar transport system permease protein|uniref:Carbohydrate ABC transporter permease n=1 Tax=Rathayibacter caricis DSM 15933 TaxID=1328867 RepID=A0A2T4USS0_9MICO|nr:MULTISPECIES: carbohydrate ABC transporter permease [Rathayibacter]KQQ09805.1 sugar ABC transporter permease [Rathayibacter sp. Leaf296]KQQ22018.1 sugar ABC transporter permease [Rathayibacter sp. Leaf299]MCJ1695910.1 carbohydrate ABC transporter permease [Rathayibacter caricis]PTL72574.1 carbohydrate ABC transporter permease [Rathayibacter caricis DSM 15933]